MLVPPPPSLPVRRSPCSPYHRAFVFFLHVICIVVVWCLCFDGRSQPHFTNNHGIVIEINMFCLLYLLVFSNTTPTVPTLPGPLPNLPEASLLLKMMSALEVSHLKNCHLANTFPPSVGERGWGISRGESGGGVVVYGAGRPGGVSGYPRAWYRSVS